MDYVPNRHAHIRKYPARSEESVYWDLFKAPVVFKEAANISHVTFSPVHPHMLAACASFKTQLYNMNPIELKREISRAKETIHAAAFRRDGQVLLLGDSSGLVQLHDVSSRSILRSMRDHQGAVRSVAFGATLTQAMSGSDDHTVKMWDIPTEAVVSTLNHHSDSVRALATSTDGNLCFSASFDNTVKLWDPRNPNECLFSLDHGAPIESACFVRNGSLLVSAGSNYLRVWDVLAGGKLLHSASHHLKMITSLFYDVEKHVILSGSLDKTVKVFSLSNFELQSSMNYPAPVLSVAVSSDSTRLAVGMAGGILSVKSLSLPPASSINTPSEKEQKIYPNTSAFFKRKGKQPTSEATITTSGRPARLATHDKFLKRFQYRAALTFVLSNGNFGAIVSVLEELRMRDAFSTSLHSLTPLELLPLVSFISKNVSNASITPLLCYYYEKLIDYMTLSACASPDLDDSLLKLTSRLHIEMAFQRDAAKILGSLNTLLSNSESLI